MFRKINIKDFIKVPAHILSHVMIIAVSAAIALSLPYTAEFLSLKFRYYWNLIGNEKIFLLLLEIVLAVLLILLLNYIKSVWKDRKLSKMARIAGLVLVSPSRGLFSRWKSRKLKESNGIARDVMVIGSTGFRTLADEKGDLHNVMQNCRGGRIMLLNPYGEGAEIRSKSILDPDITLERFREQILKSISFLKELRAVQKDIRLKLYSEAPFLKIVISGDYLWLKHYHAGLDVKSMPEYVFKHNQEPGNFYLSFYQYFLKKWNDPRVPEYDLERDELIYRDSFGNEERREKFMGLEPATSELYY